MVKFIVNALGRFLKFYEKFSDYCIREYEKTMFRSIGKDVYIGHECVFSYENLYIGNHTYIGDKCVLQSAHGLIEIGNHVMFGAGVHIHGGNHIYNVIGKYMDEVGKEKGVDGVVKVEDDVWVGSNAIILGGVTLGEGCIVGAGAVVTKSVEPYSIVAGNPAHVIKMRFNPQEIEIHKKEIK